MAAKRIKFEEAMQRLQEIVNKLESGEETLENSMKLFEEGAKLLRECTARLDQAEQTVTLLTLDQDGQEHEADVQGEN